MQIGIIGTGSMGRALGLRWARTGHSVLFGSRDRAKAEAVASEGKGNARAGDFDDAAAFGEIVLYTPRAVFPSQLLRHPEALAGKVVIDCNNSDVPDDFRYPPPIPSLAERLAADVPDARVVKAFNTLPAQLIGMTRASLEPHRISVFLCADDAAAKATVGDLAEELGFVAVDSGELERSRLVEGLADFLRFQIAGMGLGMSATLSLHIVEGLERELP